VFFIGERPAFPGLVHGGGGVAPLEVGLGSEVGQHGCQAGVAVQGREAGEHIGDMQDIVPDEGIFEFAVIRSGAKQVIFLAVALRPVRQEHFTAGLDRRAAVVLGQAGQRSKR